MSDAPPSSGRAKVAGAAVAAVFLALFAWKTFDTISSRPRIVRAPQDAAAPARAQVAALIGATAPQFGIDAARDPRQAAPPIELAALDGSRVSLAAARGQVVFVNFWATWCPPCRDEMPSMVQLGQDLASRYPGQFKMIAVSVDESPAAIASYFAAPPFAGPPKALAIVRDGEQRVTPAYYGQARGFATADLKFPETYIVDKSGRLVAYVVGPRDWSDPSARAFLEALIRS